MPQSPVHDDDGAVSHSTLIRARGACLALLVTSWLVTRAILFAGTLSGEVALDVSAYQRWAADVLEGGSPASDTAFVYPPGSYLVFLAPQLIAPEVYFRTFTILATLVDFVLLLALILFVCRRSSGWIAPWAWVLMGFLAGPLMYERYDIFAALLGVLAVLTLSRPALSGALAGLGLLLKLWPEIAILGVPRQRMVRALVVNGVVILVGWVLLELIWADSFGFVPNVLNKGASVEAVVAYPFLVARNLVGSHGVTGQFGSWEVIGDGVSLAATAMTVFGVLLLMGLFALRMTGRLDHVSPGDIVLLGVLIFVATHKINSLQYGVWIAAMTAAALAYKSSRAFGPAVLLALMLAVSNQVIWEQFVPFISGNPLLLGMQGLRLCLLFAAAIWLAVSIRRRSQSAPTGVGRT